jgi:hypothetical protein
VRILTLVKNPTERRHHKLQLKGGNAGSLKSTESCQERKHVNDFQRAVRTEVYRSFRDESVAPSAGKLSRRVGASGDQIATALRVLADEHCLVLLPGTDSIWMAHPFSGIETDFAVTVGKRRWFANCAWDGLSVLALFGDGILDTHSPGSGDSLRFEVHNGVVSGEGIVHFLVPAARFWDDIGYT